jgi:hypothetical protein
MERRAELLKSFASRLARAALSDGAARIIQLLQISGYLGADGGRARTDDADGVDPGHDQLMGLAGTNQVGVWERMEADGKSCFVRSPNLFKEWYLWANVDRIEPKSAKLRVVLIGESVARGFLYDPVFTPAIALEKILQSQLGESEIEVIDLARTNIGFEVGELAGSALLLDPDLVIFFVGNNWGISYPGLAEVLQMDVVLREEGIVGVKKMAEAQVAGNAGRLVNEVSKVYQNRGVPLVWVIPEFNLGDWREPATNAPCLPHGLNREWIASQDEARQALQNGELDRASELAQKMVEIDGGICVAGFYLLAECARRRADVEAERQYLELARDAVIWDSSRVVVPRPYSVVQEALRNEARGRQDQIVDLPELFKEHLNGDLPGRRLFLDYCHLTTEGIQVAMAAAASAVLRSLKGRNVPWNKLMAAQVSPTCEIEAEASFLAAIHNAHYSQSFETVLAHCLRSLHQSPDIAQVMINFIELQTRRTMPAAMSRSAERIVELGSPLISRYLFPQNRQRFDRSLLEAMVEALKEVGVETREWLGKIWREEHSVASTEINLLDYYYCSSADQPQEVMWARPIPEDELPSQGADYYKAYHPYSRFVFVGEAGIPAQLSLTCRLPASSPSQDIVRVEVNGKPQVEIVVDHRWGNWEITVAEDVIGDGVNEVVIHWPIYELADGATFEGVMESLFQGIAPDFFQIFGEIHSFRASKGGTAR